MSFGGGWGWNTQKTGSGTGAGIVGQPVNGPIDGVNQTFTTLSKYDPATLRLYLNGQRQKENAGGIADYLMAESGGSGTGFDTVVFTGYAPRPNDVILVDYYTP